MLFPSLPCSNFSLAVAAVDGSMEIPFSHHFVTAECRA